MIALVSGFDGDILQSLFVEQETCELGARARVAVGRMAIALQHTPNPETGSEYERENAREYEDIAHPVIVACL